LCHGNGYPRTGERTIPTTDPGVQGRWIRAVFDFSAITSPITRVYEARALVLGGLVTLIGTPPNIIISGFRQSVTGEDFAMFEFALVGISIEFVGIGFLVIVFRVLLP
jgi:di/tricarboxylate transporter